MGLQFVTTADGSKTLYDPRIGEHYHSLHGALQESRHVFINSGLIWFLAGRRCSHLSVLEIGFGTGLNFLLSAEYAAAAGVNLEYTGIEAYPLDTKTIAATGYGHYVPEQLWVDFQHWYPSAINHLIPVNTKCRLKLAHDKLLDFESAEKYDLIYFDAFAAARQPGMWNDEAISHVVSFMKPDAALVTYAITGNLKRQLKALGLQIEKLPGAPGKREMLRAVK